jgi:hypothetical protein
MVDDNEYTPKAIRDWFHRSLGVNATPSANEICTYCPECGGDVFYFNVKKQVGICHKASCDYRPTLTMLIELVGFAPDEAGYFDQAEEAKQVTVTLPGHPIALLQMDKLMTSNQDALDYLRGRFIPDEVTVNWGLTSDGERIYVPVYDESGALVNFNSRLMPGFLGPKYLYCRGAKTGKYLLGWSESRLWDTLCLVENTFVSLRYRNQHHCSTTFGSNVSDAQVQLIAESNVRQVAILWDEGAEKKAHKAVAKLRAKGVKAAYWKIKGQPDDHSDEFVSQAVDQVLEQCSERRFDVDLREQA